MSETPLELAGRLQAQAAAVGFDWPDVGGILDKLAEELAELRQALDTGLPQADIEDELGDLLFVMVNLARRLHCTPERALALACGKFERRFAHIERVLQARGLRPEDSTLAEMEALWQQAKQRERGG